MKEKKYKSLLLLLALFLCASGALVPEDESFKEFCKNAGGTIITSTPVNNIVTQGAQCKNAHLGGLLANDQEDAERICKHYSPFHWIEAKIDRDGFITCTYETLFICRPGFKQINGRCYRVENGRKSTVFVKAQQVCTSAGLKLYQHQDERTAGFIGLLFKDLSAIWATVDESGLLFDVDFDNGTQYAILYGISSIFNVGPNSLVKIGNDQNAMVVCEYTPDETIMSLRSKVKMLSKYIHPAVVQGEFSAWRTFNHYLPDLNIHDTLFDYHQGYCKQSLSALMDSKNAKLFDSTIAFMQKLGGQLRDHTVFLSSFRHCKNNKHDLCSASSAWQNPTEPMSSCWTSPRWFFTDNVYQIQPCHLCPIRSTGGTGEDMALMLAYQPNGKYEYWGSRPRPAPMLCDVMFSGIGVYDPCPPEWTEFVRQDGTKACHRYHTTKMVREDARQYCVDNYGATLAGAHSEDEFKTIVKMGATWLSVKKASSCRYMSRNQGDPCFEARAFYDPDDVSNEEGIKAMINHLYWSQPEGSSEFCLTWNGDFYKVHDYECTTAWEFVCTMVSKWKMGSIKYQGA